MTSWIDSEPGPREAFRELARLARRSRARALSIFAVSLALALAAAGWDAYKGRTYESRIVYRVSESDIDAVTAPRPKKQLRQYVAESLLSNQQLLALMERFDLYPKLRKRDALLALDSMREDIEIDVWRNYFIEARLAGDAGRSARIGIAYRAKDAKLAFEVVQALGQVVAEAEAREREHAANWAVAQAERGVTQLRDKIARRQSELTTREVALANAKNEAQAGALRMETANLRRSMAELDLSLKDLQKRAADLELRASMEKAQLGMRFELVDGGRAQRVIGSALVRGAIVGGALFVLLLPFVALLLSALDSRVHELEDIRRLGLRPLGHL